MLLSAVGTFASSNYLLPAAGKESESTIYRHYVAAFSLSSDSQEILIVDRDGPKILDRTSLSIVHKYDVPELASLIDPGLESYRDVFMSPYWLFTDWSSNGKTLAAARKAAVYIFSPSSEKPLCVIKYVPEIPPELGSTIFFGISGIALSPDGQWIAISTESAVSVYSCANGLRLYQYVKIGHKTCCPRWSPDGRYIAAARAEHSQTFASEIHIWHAESGNYLTTFVSAWQGTPEYTWLPDGRLFAVATESGITFYDLEKSFSTPQHKMQLSEAMLFSWSSNGKLVAVYDSCKSSRAVELRVLLSDRVIKHIYLGKLANDLRIGSCALKLSINGSLLAMLHFGGPLIFWQL